MHRTTYWSRGGAVALAAVALTLSTAAAAQSAPATRGSAAILTNRNCTTTTNGDCRFAGPRTFTQYAGGAGSAFSVSATNEANSGAAGSAYASFAGNAVPTLGVASFAGANTRTGASALAYQTFTYTGTDAINLALAGTLHFFGSGDLRQTGMPGVEAAGSGFFVGTLGIMPTSILAEFGTSAEELVTGDAAFSACGSGARAYAFATSNGLGAGEHSIPLSLNSTCDGGAITISQGQSFVVLATVQALSNKGGFLDASHTFSSFFDPTATTFAATGAPVGQAFLRQSIASVPEPGSWALMIAGFGLLGAALRQRRAKPAPA